MCKKNRSEFIVLEKAKEQFELSKQIIYAHCFYQTIPILIIKLNLGSWLFREYEQ